MSYTYNYLIPVLCRSQLKCNITDVLYTCTISLLLQILYSANLHTSSAYDKCAVLIQEFEIRKLRTTDIYGPYH